MLCDSLSFRSQADTYIRKLLSFRSHLAPPRALSLLNFALKKKSFVSDIVMDGAELPQQVIRIGKYK